MATSSGHVKRIMLLNENVAKIVIDPGAAADQTFLLWTAQELGTASGRTYRNNLLSLSRDALIFNKRIEVTHNDNSAIINTLIIDQ